MRAGAPLLLLLVAAIGLGGCSTTLVQSLPIGKTTTCDPTWPGRWKVVAPDTEHSGGHGWLEINADCTVLTFVDTEKTDRENHRLTLVSTRAGDFLATSDADGKPECIGADSSHCGQELMRYERSGDEIRLYMPDHKSVHDAIASRVVSGYTEAHSAAREPAEGTTTSASPLATDAAPTVATASPSETANTTPTYSNQIAGSPEQIASILRQHPEFFASTPWMILQRDRPITESPNP
ncbi:MAG TPA: hypothetical protein VK660_03040 [Xanthomonadaceae bacterium]|jgi:hypothetical protein|nr:hypothetical protein [Xanthomonadaceae bacterium]